MTDHPDRQCRESDGWVSDDGGLSWRDPAPYAAKPINPSQSFTVEIGAAQPEPSDELLRLRAEAEALRKDAELYRSLREIYSGLFCGMHGMSPYVVFNKPLIQPMYFKPEMLDAAIAATKEQQA